jgi:hypothetical protein
MADYGEVVILLASTVHLMNGSNSLEVHQILSGRVGLPELKALRVLVRPVVSLSCHVR